IRFSLIEGSNDNDVLSLLKEEVDGFPVVRKDINLMYRELMPRPSMVVALSNVFVKPKHFTMLYDFLKQAKEDEIAEIAFGEKNCHVSLGRLQGTSFHAVANISLKAFMRNRLVPPRPVWRLDIPRLRRLYEVLSLPTSKSLMCFGDRRVVAGLKMSNGIVVARVMYLTKGLLYENMWS
ncbi:hypothetical protein MKX03_008531, partial [Papaver bracteatum]